jgi:hypothetical protein
MLAPEGKYIYCIIKNKDFIDFGPLGIGERGDRVYTIPYRDISAVVSDTLRKRYPVARENLIPHERAIEEVMKSYTVLPVRFATIAGDEVRVKKILEKEYDRFIDLLKDMEGKKELGLKAIFKEEIVYKDILANYEEIRMQREKMEKVAPSANVHPKLIEIGRLVESALSEERTRYKEEILYTLEPLALEVKTSNSYYDLVIINAAFLIEEKKESEFDKKVRDITGKYDDKIKFKYVGTVPPFNFVNVVIHTGDL